MVGLSFKKCKNDLGYGQLSNPNQLLMLLLKIIRNHRKHLLEYFHYLGQGFHHISFLELISSNIGDKVQ